MAPVQYLTRLRELDLSWTRVKRLEPLKNLVNLEQLDLTGAPIKSLKPLFDLKKLTRLGLSKNNRVPKSEIRTLKRRRPKLTIYVGR